MNALFFVGVLVLFLGGLLNAVLLLRIFSLGVGSGTAADDGDADDGLSAEDELIRSLGFTRLGSVLLPAQSEGAPVQIRRVYVDEAGSTLALVGAYGLSLVTVWPDGHMAKTAWPGPKVFPNVRSGRSVAQASTSYANAVTRHNALVASAGRNAAPPRRATDLPEAIAILDSAHRVGNRALLRVAPILFVGPIVAVVLLFLGLTAPR